MLQNAKVKLYFSVAWVNYKNVYGIALHSWIHYILSLMNDAGNVAGIFESSMAQLEIVSAVNSDSLKEICLKDGGLY